MYKYRVDKKFLKFELNDGNFLALYYKIGKNPNLSKKLKNWTYSTSDKMLIFSFTMNISDEDKLFIHKCIKEISSKSETQTSDFTNLDYGIKNDYEQVSYENETNNSAQSKLDEIAGGYNLIVEQVSKKIMTGLDERFSLIEKQMNRLSNESDYRNKEFESLKSQISSVEKLYSSLDKSVDLSPITNSIEKIKEDMNVFYRNDEATKQTFVDLTVDIKELSEKTSKAIARVSSVEKQYEFLGIKNKELLSQNKSIVEEIKKINGEIGYQYKKITEIQRAPGKNEKDVSELRTVTQKNTKQMESFLGELEKVKTNISKSLELMKLPILNDIEKINKRFTTQQKEISSNCEKLTELKNMLQKNYESSTSNKKEIEKTIEYVEKLETALKTNSKLTEFFEKINASFDELSKSFDKLVADVDSKSVDTKKSLEAAGNSISDCLSKIKSLSDKVGKFDLDFNKLSVVVNSNKDVVLKVDSLSKQLKQDIYSTSKHIRTHLEDLQNPHQVDHCDVKSNQILWNAKQITGFDIETPFNDKSIPFFDKEKRKIAFREDFSIENPREINFMFTSNNSNGGTNSFNWVDSLDWRTAGEFEFSGTDSWKPNSISVLLSMHGCEETGKVYFRLYDKTNKNTIANVEHNEENPTSFFINELENLPTKDAIIEIQLKVECVGAHSRIHSFKMSSNKTRTI